MSLNQFFPLQNIYLLCLLHVYKKNALRIILPCKQTINRDQTAPMGDMYDMQASPSLH